MQATIRKAISGGTMLAVLALAWCSPLQAYADTLATPSGPIILTVSGDIEKKNQGLQAVFDLDMLRQLSREDIETTTIWTDGTQVFGGVRLKDLMDLLGVTQGTIRATAINDYAVEIPMSDATDGAAMIAYSRNGTPMSVRYKGPLWLVYPFDSDPRFQSDVYYSRSIWQLDRLEILR